jgi:RNA polymerase sigma-70 factor (ECF subfamily)
MLTFRTNHEWIQALAKADFQQSQAVEDLRTLLLRAALYTLSQSLNDLRDLDPAERIAMAEDCAQDALLAVLAHLEDFRGESKFTTWVYQFGVNIARTRARQERWKGISLDQLADNVGELDWLKWRVESPISNSEHAALKGEAIAEIREIIREQLTDRQRLVLKLIAFDGVSMDVVVHHLGSNRNAIYKLLHDARLKVKRGLVARGYDIEEIFGLFNPRS